MVFPVVIAGLLGLVVGSFLNVCIYRVPKRLSVAMPRSFCPSCGTPIRALDNIPLLSFAVLRGRCRHCREPISPRYPLVELTTGLLFMASYLSFGATLTAVRVVVLACVLLVSIFIDLDHQIIPDAVTLPALAFGLASAIPLGGSELLRSFVGALAGAGAVFAIALLGNLLFGQESMGGGDLKLAAAIGAYTGWAPALGVLILSFFLAFPVVALGMLTGKLTPTSKIPFGPFIAMAGFLVLFWGPRLWQVYTSVLY